MLLEQDCRQACSTNIDHLTPLHQASLMGRSEIVELLLVEILASGIGMAVLNGSLQAQTCELGEASYHRCTWLAAKEI